MNLPQWVEFRRGLVEEEIAAEGSGEAFSRPCYDCGKPIKASSSDNETDMILCMRCLRPVCMKCFDDRHHSFYQPDQCTLPSEELFHG